MPEGAAPYHELRKPGTSATYWLDSSSRGKNNAISGNMVSIAIAPSIGITKIIAPFDTSLKFTPGTTDLSTNKLNPTGGEIAAISD